MRTKDKQKQRCAVHHLKKRTATCERLILVLSLGVLLSSTAAWAQVLAPNDAGVSMGHFHTIVRDMEAAKKFWILVGGTPIKVDETEVMKFPGVLVFLTSGSPSGGSRGTTVDHPGFNVRSGEEFLSKMVLNGSGRAAYSNQGYGLRLEFNNLGFYLDNTDDLRVEILPTTHYPQTRGIPGAELPGPGPIASDHIHFSFPEASAADALGWYVKMFGAKLYSDGISTRNPAKPEMAALIPGIEMKFSKSRNGSVLPTKGRALDHIGFEVKNLQAFCKKLEASGVKFDQPYSKSRHKSFASAELTDPWGTSIELTEGLNLL